MSEPQLAYYVELWDILKAARLGSLDALVSDLVTKGVYPQLPQQWTVLYNSKFLFRANPAHGIASETVTRELRATLQAIAEGQQIISGVERIGGK